MNDSSKLVANSSRVFWFIGLNKKGIESFSEAKLRAKEAVAFVEKTTDKNEKTLLLFSARFSKWASILKLSR